MMKMNEIFSIGDKRAWQVLIEFKIESLANSYKADARNMLAKLWAI